MNEPNHAAVFAVMRDSRRRGLGYLAYTLGLASGIGGALLLHGMFGRGEALWFALAFGLLLVVAIVLFGLAEWWLVPSVRQVCARDPRPPVLYLRPFGEDRELTYDEFHGGETTTTLTAKAEDFLLALNAVGPLVSIAQPDRSARFGLHPLGAARDYVGGGDWQARVLELLDRAGMVVLAIGDSPGIEWEIARVRERIGPESLLLYLPPRPVKAWTRRGREEKERALYAGFRPLVERHFGLRMPPFSAALHLIGFHADGEPVLALDAPRRGWTLTEYGRVAGTITAQLKAVLARLRPDVELDRYRVPGRAAMYARIAFAALVVGAVALLAVFGDVGGDLASLVAPPLLPGLALVTGWVLLARHFRRRWVWSIPLLIVLILALNTGFNLALHLGWWPADRAALAQWRGLLIYPLHVAQALTVLVLGLTVGGARPAADDPGRRR